MSRALTPELFHEFQRGTLYPLLQEVQSDDTLCLEFRGDSANIYYRGGSLFKISRIGNQYGLSFDIKYNIKKDPQLVAKTTDIRQAISLIPYYKRAMDYYLCIKKEALEKETQQLILRENNFTKESGGSDYYILDIEYNDTNASQTENRKGRYDMVAIKWISQGASRKDTGRPTLALIEIKYGDKALKNDAGIKKHLDDYAALFCSGKKISEICDDMSKLYEQKHLLGLLRGLDGKNQGSIKISPDEAEAIFIFANHDPDKSTLKTELQSINWSDYAFPVRIAASSSMGYNLYANKMLSVAEFISTL